MHESYIFVFVLPGQAEFLIQRLFLQSQECASCAGRFCLACILNFLRVRLRMWSGLIPYRTVANCFCHSAAYVYCSATDLLL